MVRLCRIEDGVVFWEDPQIQGSNRVFHRMLVYGVTVEYRDKEGRVRGAQAQVIAYIS